MDHSLPETVFITGVSSGIGLGLAEHYLAAGANVFGVSRRTPALSVGQSRFHFAPLDLADAQAVKETLPQLLAELKRLDLVVLNAGVLGPIADLRDTPLDDLKQVMDVNLWANKTVLDSLLELPLSVRQVVAISSGAAVNGNRGWGGYSISKAALNMLIKLYAAENPSIHFAAVAPGLVDTAMQDQLCGMTDQTGIFPSLKVLQAKRGGPDMPRPAEIAPRLADYFEKLRDNLDSGEFTDIRT